MIKIVKIIAVKIKRIGIILESFENMIGKGPMNIMPPVLMFLISLPSILKEKIGKRKERNIKIIPMKASKPFP